MAREAPSDRGAGHDAASETLVALVAEALERLDRDGPAALDALCLEHPERAGELRARIERLQSAGLTAGTGARLPERLGAFRILAPIGGGGMGLVVRAQQEGLGRTVALKLVRPELLHLAGSRERFRREIAAVARLQHACIVPVFAGGEEGGIPYFAMELVDGASLEEVLGELAGRVAGQLTGADLAGAIAAVQARRVGASSDGVAPARSPSDAESAARLFGGSWASACLRIARHLAEALQHAHERGVLHRDVKPSNVLVTRDGRVLLIDFGLAAAQGSERLTASGSQVGSLAWMSPEQVRGEHGALDARTDVYSLGATLAELLTLRAPFAGPDAEATRRNILDGRPLRLRAQEPSVPHDAETVCQVAVDRDPARRYASAAALADDLGRVLERRPILARRPGPLRRARRWAQRRPAAAVGVLLGALLLLAGPIGWELNRMRTVEQLEAAAERSDRHFGAALSAIGEVLRGLAVDGTEDVPRLQRARLVAIDRALELFPALERDRPQDPLVIREGAALHTSRGEVLRDLGRPEDALVEFERAIERHRALLARAPDDAQRLELVRALSRAGKALESMARHADARPYLEEAAKAMREVAAAADAPPGAQSDLAVALANLARMDFALGALDASEALAREAHGVAAAARELHPASAHALSAEGRVAIDLADVLAARGRPDERTVWTRRGLEAYRAAAAAEPAQRYYAFDVTTGLGSLAGDALERGDFDTAETALGEALALIDALLRDFPESSRYRTRRLDTLDQLALSAGQQGDHARAFERFAAGLVEKDALVAASPARCDLALDAARTRVNMANALLQDVRRLDEVPALLGRALALLGACEDGAAPPPHVAQLASTARYLEALALSLLDRTADAASAIERFDAGARDAQALRQSADLWNEWILALRRSEPDAAVRAAREPAARERMFGALRRAIEAGYDDAHELASTPALASFRDDPEFVALLAGLDAGG